MQVTQTQVDLLTAASEIPYIVKNNSGLASDMRDMVDALGKMIARQEVQASLENDAKPTGFVPCQGVLRDAAKFSLMTAACDNLDCRNFGPMHHFLSSGGSEKHCCKCYPHLCT